MNNYLYLENISYDNMEDGIGYSENQISLSHEVCLNQTLCLSLSLSLMYFTSFLLRIKGERRRNQMCHLKHLGKGQDGNKSWNNKKAKLDDANAFWPLQTWANLSGLKFWTRYYPGQAHDDILMLKGKDFNQSLFPSHKEEFLIGIQNVHIT